VECDINRFAAADMLRITSEHAGLESYEVSLEKERVVVHPKTATYDDVLQKISKTGKEVCALCLVAAVA